jgi:predicted RNA-binding Zn ribbon-like protein
MSKPSAPALFVADSLGLDFLNSIATPTDTPMDWLEGGEGLLAWLEQSELVSAAVVAAVRSRALPGELDGAAGQARSLREWFRAFVRERMGRPLTSGDLGALGPLNRLLARDEAFRQVVAREPGPGLEVQPTRRWRSAESLLLPIGEALAACVSEEDFANVKACEGASCTLLFADHTRGHARRWCSMAICGNRAKVAAHRKRLKEG